MPKSFSVEKGKKFKSPSKNNEKFNTSGSDKVIAAIVLCALTPNPSACLAGVAGAKPSQSIDDLNTPSQRTSSGISSTQCSTDSQCGFNKKCVKKLGRSICFDLFDANGNEKDARGNEARKCRSSSDCPSRFKCDRQFKVCVKR